MNDDARGGTAARGEMILYSTEDGQAAIQLRAEEGTVWLTQAQLAELFDTTKQNVSLHLRNILAEGEVGQSVVKESLIPASDGKRYRVKIYNLDAILAVGYRVRSPHGVPVPPLGHHGSQGVPGQGLRNGRRAARGSCRDYFDDLLDRIRAIRASEAPFYAKVRSLLYLNSNCNPARDIGSAKTYLEEAAIGA